MTPTTIYTHALLFTIAYVCYATFTTNYNAHSTLAALDFSMWPFFLATAIFHQLPISALSQSRDLQGLYSLVSQDLTKL